MISSINAALQDTSDSDIIFGYLYRILNDAQNDQSINLHPPATESNYSTVDIRHLETEVQSQCNASACGNQTSIKNKEVNHFAVVETRSNHSSEERDLTYVENPKEAEGSDVVLEESVARRSITQMSTMETTVRNCLNICGSTRSSMNAALEDTTDNGIVFGYLSSILDNGQDDQSNNLHLHDLSNYHIADVQSHCNESVYDNQTKTQSNRSSEKRDLTDVENPEEIEGTDVVLEEPIVQRSIIETLTTQVDTTLQNRLNICTNTRSSMNAALEDTTDNDIVFGYLSSILDSAHVDQSNNLHLRGTESNYPTVDIRHLETEVQSHCSASACETRSNHSSGECDLKDVENTEETQGSDAVLEEWLTQLLVTETLTRAQAHSTTIATEIGNTDQKDCDTTAEKSFAQFVILESSTDRLKNIYSTTNSEETNTLHAFEKTICLSRDSGNSVEEVNVDRTSSNSNNDLKNEDAPTDKKQFKCELCNRTYCRAVDLKEHMLTHTDEKPFKCNLCEYRTDKKFNLKRHVVVHTNERPFKCDVCNKSFRQDYNVRRHMRIHTRPNEAYL